MATNHANVNDFISTMCKAHTSKILTTSIAWEGHVDYYNNVVIGHALSKNQRGISFMIFFSNIAMGLTIYWALLNNKQ